MDYYGQPAELIRAQMNGIVASLHSYRRYSHTRNPPESKVLKKLLKSYYPKALTSTYLDKADTYGAHTGECIHSLEALRDAGVEELCKLLVVEDLEVAVWRDLDHSGRVPAVSLVAVGTLHEDGRVRQTLRKHLATDVVETCATACNRSQCN